MKVNWRDVDEGKPAPRAPKRVKSGNGPGRPSGPDPVERFNLTIPKDLHAKATAKAKREDKTFSKVVSELLAKWVSA